MWKSSIALLRKIGIMEGISYLILLFIAMPLKYFADIPIYVQIFGMAHGILFILFVLVLLVVWVRHRWSFLSVFGAFMASLIPFGTFVLDVRLRKK
jgi:integral membrane protein